MKGKDGPVRMESPPRDDVADVLRKRGRCLEALVAGPRSKRDLRDAFDIPRSTLDRAIRELEDAGLVEAAGPGYRATAFGRVAHRAHEEYLASLGAACDAADVLWALPPDTALDHAFLDGATVCESSPFAPDNVVETLFESVGDADHVRGVAPIAMTGYTEEFRDRALAGGGRLTLVLAEGVVETLERAQETEWNETVAHADVTLHRAAVPFEFGLWLADAREAGVVVYTDTGIRGIVRNDSAAALAWAEEQYERAVRSATPLDRESPPSTATDD